MSGEIWLNNVLAQLVIPYLAIHYYWRRVRNRYI